MGKSHAPVSAARSDVVTIYVPLELSKSRWLIGIYDPVQDKLSRHQVDGGNVAKLRDLIEQKRRRVAASTGGTVRVVSCYEAGRDGFWLHRRLTEEGLTNLVLDPASLQVNRRARRAKTDRIDLDGLWRAVMAHERGEPRACSVVRVPEPEVEDAQRPGRQRKRLVGERTAHRNRIKALLFGQGIREFAPGGPGWRERLTELRTGDGRALPHNLRDELIDEHARLELVQEQLRRLKARQRIAETPATVELTAKADRLQQLKSLGPVLVEMLIYEVFWRSFQNRRQLGGFVGMTGSPFQSGDTNREQGISKAGPPRVRAALIELAWLWLRHQPDSALSQWFQARVGTTANGRLRRIMIVALARKLLVALWRFVETGLVPAGAVLKPAKPAAAA